MYNRSWWWLSVVLNKLLKWSVIYELCEHLFFTFPVTWCLVPVPIGWPGCFVNFIVALVNFSACTLTLGCKLYNLVWTTLARPVQSANFIVIFITLLCFVWPHCNICRCYCCTCFNLKTLAVQFSTYRVVLMKGSNIGSFSFSRRIEIVSTII